MRLFFICAYAVAAYANLYVHIRMTPHRKIRTVYADMWIRICAECGYTAYAHMKSQLKCATRSENDFENVNCTNCELSSN